MSSRLELEEAAQRVPGGDVQESEALLSYALEANHTGAWVLNLDDHSTTRTLTHDRIFGYETKLPRWTYEMFLDHVLPEDRSEVDRRFQEAVANLSDWTIECRIRRADGEVRWIMVAGSAERHPEGPVQMTGLVRDITKGQRADELLRTAAAYTRSLIEASLDPLVTISAEGKITDVNEASVKVTGVPRERLIGTDFSECFTEPAKAREGYQRVFSEGFVRDYPLAIRHVSGSVTDVLYNASVYRDTQGRVLGVFAAARDITARKRAEDAQRNAAAYARSLIEASLDPLVTINAEGKITDVNEASVKATGVPREELIGTDFSEYFTEPVKAREGYQRVFSEGFVRDYPLAIRHVSGSVTDVLYNATVYHDTQGRVTGVFAAARDITEQKRAEQKINQLAAIVASSDDAIVGKTLDGIITSWNRGAESIYGYSESEVIGKPISILIPPGHADELPRILDRIRSGEHVKHFETVRCRKDGQRLHMALTISSVHDSQGQLVAVSTIARDITERRQLEERVRQSQKMEGIGHLAGGMAHEFNNILGAILMSLDAIKMLNEDAETLELLREIGVLAKRAADLIRQLLAFSRQSVIQLEPLNLAATVAQQHVLLGRLFGERVVLEYSCADNLPWVSADKSALEQVLLNLCLNARDAMPSGGRLRLQLAEVKVGEKQAKAHENANPGSYVCLSVSDTGSGMDSGTMKRLFEPFFTTKGVGRGTGLGLATTRGIVEQHHGWVEVESVLGRGSTFRVYLPSVPQPAAVAPAVSEVVTVTGSGVILLVEDEPALRKLTRSLLIRNGYRVFDAEDGNAALALWANHHAEIDLLFTDMVMPGDWTGLQLAERFVAEKPNLKVIVTSGYHTEVTEADKNLSSHILHVPKPCAPAALTSIIRKLLQAG